MATVVRKENEDTESLLRRFKKAVGNEGIMEELRRREYYVSKSQKEKLKHENAMKREMKFKKKMNDYN